MSNRTTLKTKKPIGPVDKHGRPIVVGCYATDVENDDASGLVLLVGPTYATIFVASDASGQSFLRSQHNVAIVVSDFPHATPDEVRRAASMLGFPSGPTGATLVAGDPTVDREGVAIAVGDVITIPSQGGVDFDIGGTVIAIIGPAVVYRTTSGKIEAWDVPKDFAVMAKGTANAPAKPVPLLADDYADATSVDVNGVRIRLFDRVWMIDVGFPAIVVALVADKLLAVVEENEGNVEVGSATYQDGSDVRVMRTPDDPRGYVCALIEKATELREDEAGESQAAATTSGNTNGVNGRA